MAARPDGSDSEPRSPIVRVRDQIDDQVTCGVCLDRYRNPRTLPCHHSFCADCIARLPVILQNGQQFVKCPLGCDLLAQLNDNVAFPPAFHINNLLEIEGLLKKIPEKEKFDICEEHNSDKDIFCETCDCQICLNCIGERHHSHKFKRAPELYKKHKLEITACLDSLKKRSGEVEQVLALYETRGAEIVHSEELAKAEIDRSIKRFVEKLQQCRKDLYRQVDGVTQKKLELLKCQKGEADAIYVQLKSCQDYVEKKLTSQSQYQMQMAKKQLIELIANTTSDARVHSLQPIQDSDTTFDENQELLQTMNLGKICGTAYYSAPGIFNVSMPQYVVERTSTEVTITSPLKFSAENLTCELQTTGNTRSSSGRECCVIATSPYRCVVKFSPVEYGSHLLKVQLNGEDIHGSPFPIYVLSLLEVRDQRLKVFAGGLNTPCGITVSQDGKVLLVAEWNGHSVIVLSSTGEVKGKVSTRFKNPWGVALSAANHIYVADANMLQKFDTIGAYINSMNVCSYGVAINHQTEMIYFVDCDRVRISMVNFNLDLVKSFGENLIKMPRDIAIDTSRNVYVTDFKEQKVHKFTADGKHLKSIGEQTKWGPHGICIDSDDIMYVTDRTNNCVKVFTTEGVRIGSFGGTRDHPFQPRGIAVDKTGNLYICDNGGQVLVSRIYNVVL